MMQMLLRCTNQNSRIGFCSLLKEVFNVVFSLEKKTLEFAILPGDSLSSDVPMDGDDLDGSDAEPLVCTSASLKHVLFLLCFSLCVFVCMRLRASNISDMLSMSL